MSPEPFVCVPVGPRITSHRAVAAVFTSDRGVRGVGEVPLVGDAGSVAAFADPLIRHWGRLVERGRGGPRSASGRAGSSCRSRGPGTPTRRLRRHLIWVGAGGLRPWRWWSGWCRRSCGSCFSGWYRLLRGGRRVVVGAGTGIVRCWRRSSSWPPLAVRGSSCRRCSGPSGPTAHRRFTEWTAARVWARLHRLVLDELGARGELDWSRCAIDSVSVRVSKGGS